MTDRTTKIRRALVQQLESWQRAGLRELPRGQAVAAAQIAEVSAESASITPSTEEIPMTAPSQPVESSPAKQSSSDNPTDALKILQQEVAGCTLCAELASTRTQTVFGVGNPDARVAFFGEAPGADEDRQGEPFVGRAGQLLTKIIAACTWSRDDVYILNTLKCRPPSNRNPEAEELSNCRPFWQRQLEIIQPEYLVCVRQLAMKEVLGTPQSQSVGQKPHKFDD